MRKYIVFLILLLSRQINAQPYFDFINVYYAKQFPSEIYKGADEGEIKNNVWSLNLNVPLSFGKKFLLVPSIGYEERTFTANDDEGITSQSLFFPLGFRYFLKDSTQSLGGALIYRYNYIKPEKPGIKNDMAGGALVYNKTFGKKFTLKGGLYYNREFFGNYFLPLLGCDWQVSDKLFVWGLLPTTACMDYAFSKAVHGGIMYKGFEESYNIESSNGYMHYTEGQLKIFSDFYLGKSRFVIRLEAGQSFEREIELKLDELHGEKHSVKPAETFVLKAGIHFRFITTEAFMTPLKPVN